MSKANETTQRAVLVTTAHRGVFFGYVPNGDSTSGDTIALERCRNVVWWAQSVRGFLGLASGGPDKSCRIGPAAPRVELRNITSVSDCSDEAVKAFEKGYWS
jgi:hypothetical protein